ncbi:MAG: hypothetical protein KAY37_12085 [Phycisphaerae bacterium]|nr:hypothetical protein [Phycisphaerae bacterium]
MKHAMDWIIRLFFESTGTLAALLGTVLFVLLVYWRRSGRPRPLLIGLGLAVVLLAVQALVVTQREHAACTLAAIEADLLKSRTEALAAALAADFRIDEVDRTAFLATVQATLIEIDFRQIKRTRLALVESAADRFVVSANYLTNHAGGQWPSPHRTGWSFTFTRTAECWKISHLRCDELDGIKNPDWLGHRP